MKYYIGIDLDHTNIKAGVVDENGTLICKESIKTRAERKANEIVRDIAYLAQNVVENSKIPWDGIYAIGVGSTGISNNETGILTHTKNLPFNNVNIRNDIKRIVPLPVYIDNKANCTALEESVNGAAKNVLHSITITIGESIECGIIINKRIYSGFNNAAGDIAHFVMVVDGEPCSCGRKGCFESYASSKALFRSMLKASDENPKSILAEYLKKDDGTSNLIKLINAMKTGDKTAKNVVDEYLHMLSEGLVNIIGVLMPEIIVLTGDINEGGDYLLKLIEEAVERINTQPSGIKKTQIKITGSNSDKVITGAAMMARSSVNDGVRS